MNNKNNVTLASTCSCGLRSTFPFDVPWLSLVPLIYDKNSLVVSSEAVQ